MSFWGWWFVSQDKTPLHQNSVHNITYKEYLYRYLLLLGVTVKNITYGLSEPEDEEDVCSLILRVFEDFVASSYSPEGKYNVKKLIPPLTMNEFNISQGQLALVA
jgi:hypothetical protein